jgi:hypothetical protein
MENQDNNKSQNEINKGDLLSVPFNNKFLQGICVDITPEFITILNHKEGEVKIQNNEQVYKFFPGQKFDIREFSIPDQNSKDKLSVVQRIDAFLTKTSVGDYKSYAKTQKGKSDLLQLLSGKLTHTMFSGKSSKIVEETKELKNFEWNAKFQVFRKSNGSLKLDVQFKSEKQDLSIYGVEVTNDEKAKLLDENKTLTFTRTATDKDTGVKTEFKCFGRYDKDLNKIVTSPYNEKIEERIKASYERKEKEKVAQKTDEKEQNNKTKKVKKSSPKVG